MMIELEMAPRAYIDIPYGPDRFGRVVRIEPRSVVVIGDTRDSVTAAGYSIINRIMAEIDIRSGIVWWRTHPQVEERERPHPDAPALTAEELEDWHCWKFRARLATSPELPDQFWEGLTTKEGDRITLTTHKVWEMIRDPLVGADSELYSESPDFGPEWDAKLGLTAYTAANMRRLRAMTLREQDKDLGFGAAAMVPPGVEVLGKTPLVGDGVSLNSVSHPWAKPKQKRRPRDKMTKRR